MIMIRLLSVSYVGLASQLENYGLSPHDSYAPFTRSSKHQANIEQTSSKYEACIKHSLHEANIKQMPSKHRAIRAYVVHVYFECICWICWICSTIARCLLDRVNGVLAKNVGRRRNIHLLLYGMHATLNSNNQGNFVKLKSMINVNHRSFFRKSEACFGWGFKPKSFFPSEPRTPSATVGLFCCTSHARYSRQTTVYLS